MCDSSSDDVAGRPERRAGRGKIGKRPHDSKPHLTYFNLWARCGHIRLLMKHAGQEFEDVVPGENGAAPWPEMKAANPSLGGVPWLEMDGKIYNQSHAILRALAAENGYEASDPWVQYESDWVFEVFGDHLEKEFWVPAIKGIQGKEPTEEDNTKAMECMCKLLDALEERFKDGRKYCAGDVLTASDFKLLNTVCAFIENPNGKFQDQFDAYNVEYQKRTNVKRIVDSLKKENGLEAYIAECHAKKYTF